MRNCRTGQVLVLHFALKLQTLFTVALGLQPYLPGIRQKHPQRKARTDFWLSVGTQTLTPRPPAPRLCSEVFLANPCSGGVQLDTPPPPKGTWPTAKASAFLCVDSTQRSETGQVRGLRWHNRPREWEGKEWCEADGRCGLRRERVQGKGSEWRPASRRRQLQTRSSHHGVMPKPPTGYEGTAGV